MAVEKYSYDTINKTVKFHKKDEETWEGSMLVNGKPYSIAARPGMKSASARTWIVELFHDILNK